MNEDMIETDIEETDLITLMEQFKLGLISRATGGGMENKDYVRIRKLLLGNTDIAHLIPQFIKSCRNTDEFWEYIKAKYGSYSERRRYIAEEINPIVEHYDSNDSHTQESYERNELLGQGGFGQVYKYTHKLLNMDFAFKVFSPAFSSPNDKHIERFFREARILFKLNHPNIIRVYDIGMIGRKPFIRMEYFPGKNLNDVLKDFGIINASKCLVLIKNIADGLAYAHDEVGVVHRDIKPSNIMVAQPNQFRIIDFGIGVFIEKELISRITKLGEGIVGGHYTAPELVANPLLIDKRSDIYSLGAIWYTMLTGRPPAGINLKQNLSSIPNVDEKYTKILLRCLDDIDNRYSSCKEVLQDIKKLDSIL